MNILGKRSDLPFSRKSDRKKEKCKVSFTQEQNIFCSQTLLDGIAHEKTIICRQLFAGHVVGSRPMKRKKSLLRMIIVIFYIKTNEKHNQETRFSSSGNFYINPSRLNQNQGSFTRFGSSGRGYIKE